MEEEGTRCEWKESLMKDVEGKGTHYSVVNEERKMEVNDAGMEREKEGLR